MMAFTQPAPMAAQRAVLYADGGYHDNEKAGGWGVHGYVYQADATDVKVRGSGVPGSSPTPKGYTAAKDEANAVQIINYVDCVAGVPTAKSNNQTELLAAKQALTYTLDKKIGDMIMYSDSKYVVDGINDRLENYSRNNWRKSDGEEIANKQDWIDVHGLMGKLRENSLAVTIAWVKGHNGNKGNERADGWASKGNTLGLNGVDKTYVIETKPEGYWKSSKDHNRMLDHPKWYFDSSEEAVRTTADGRYIFMTGSHGDDEDVAKPQADYSNAVLFLKEDIPILEVVRQHFVQFDKQKVGHMFVGVLRSLLSPAVENDIERFGMDILRRNRSNWSLRTEQKIPVVHHITPTGLAYYNVGHLEGMQDVLTRFCNDDKAIISTDITDLLYEAMESKAVTARKLRKDITSAVKHLDVSVRFNTAFARELRAMDDIPTKLNKIRLIVGSDIIGRNALSALAGVIKRVVVITWRESDTVFRYATVVETTDDIGLWANPFGNFKLVS